MPNISEPPGGGGTANPGWYRDPWGRSAWRWWDGWQWSGWLSPPEGVTPAVVRQLVVDSAPLSKAPPEAPARERLPGGAPAGVGSLAGTDPTTPRGSSLGPPAAFDSLTAPGPVASNPETLADGPSSRPAYARGLEMSAGPGLSPPPVSPAEAARPVPRSDRRRIAIELVIVLAIFPLPYVLSALQQLVASALGEGPGQRIPTIFPGHVAAGFPFVLFLVALPLAAAALVMYLLSLPGADGGPKAIGLDRTQIRADLALLLPVFFVCNLVPILGGGVLLRALGVRGVSPSLGHLPTYYDVAFVAMAVVAGIVEEVVVLGFLVRRLEQLGLRPIVVVLVAVAVRGSYHLYYGWDVLPILAWATVTVLFYRRYRRLAPFILVHVLWDTGVFLAGRFLLGEAMILTVSSIVFTAMWWHYLPPKPTVAVPGSEPPAWHGN